ncbi:hypothetical protein HPB48_001818 [Haemaphysalis longicornis]|uniref:CCHC-type domain-containing protein n=1 Tax=Haemaphysalis longicornis TaxID=44386 RepID=A0A9J6G3W6_HAELO|nr:hypothetical protein HPB48_001818 [Haemaphysalis longicornis]
MVQPSSQYTLLTRIRLDDLRQPWSRGYVTLLTEKQTELRALDAKIHSQLSDEAFQADYATAWDYEHSICEIRARGHTARSSPSAVSGPLSSAAGGHIRKIEGFDALQHPGRHRMRSFLHRQPQRYMRSHRRLLVVTVVPFVTGHGIARRTANVPPEEKRRRLHAGRHCFRCGKQNHVARACQTARTLSCSRCSRRHLTSLCDVAQPGSAHATRGPAHSAQTVPRGIVGGYSVNYNHAAHSTTGPNGQLLVRVLLEPGSQRTFVRRDVSRALGCSVEGLEYLKLVTFGKSHHEAAEKYPRVSVTVASQNNGKQVAINALEVPSICVVTSPPITDDTLRLMHDHGLFAADTSPASAYMDDHIRILIGSDFYWQVTSGNISRLTQYLTAVETMFGWTLQGAHSDETGWISGLSSALFLALMDPSLDDAAADNELSSLWRLDAIKKPSRAPGASAFVDLLTSLASSLLLANG